MEAIFRRFTLNKTNVSTRMRLMDRLNSSNKKPGLHCHKPLSYCHHLIVLPQGLPHKLVEDSITLIKKALFQTELYLIYKQKYSTIIV
jgi:hypothetical protein